MRPSQCGFALAVGATLVLAVAGCPSLNGGQLDVPPLFFEARKLTPIAPELMSEIGERDDLRFTGLLKCSNHNPAHVGATLEQLLALKANNGCEGFAYIGAFSTREEDYIRTKGIFANLDPNCMRQGGDCFEEQRYYEWVTMPTRVTFARRGARIDDMARAILAEAHAAIAHRNDIVRVRIEGHSSAFPSSEANQALGQERARNTMDFLVGMGLPRELFEFVSHGESRPVHSGTSASTDENERVEISILVRRQPNM